MTFYIPMQQVTDSQLLVSLQRRFLSFRDSSPIGQTAQTCGLGGSWQFMSMTVESLAMQKVEGSSPFIRFIELAGNGGFSLGLERPTPPPSHRRRTRPRAPGPELRAR